MAQVATVAAEVTTPQESVCVIRELHAHQPKTRLPRTPSEWEGLTDEEKHAKYLQLVEKLKTAERDAVTKYRLREEELLERIRTNPDLVTGLGHGT